MLPTESAGRKVAAELSLPPSAVANTITLLEEGATVPFIARYRKEKTGSLDEVQIAAVRDGLQRFNDLQKRKEAIRSSLRERQLLDDGLDAAIEAAESLTILEDIYLPHRPKKKTRAMSAREKGLAPLAEYILAGKAAQDRAASFLKPDQGIATIDEALAGARDIVAESISENREVRRRLRRLFAEEAIISSKVVPKMKEEAATFRDYFDWQESVTRAAGHRLLALFRGETLKYLTVSLRPPPEKALAAVRSIYMDKGSSRRQLALALEDSYGRLLAPSLENELRRNLKKRADAEAIEVFANNLEGLLLSSPLGQKRVLALDPGYRTGAKLVCLDGQGSLLHTTTIYPTQGEKQRQKAAETLKMLVQQYAVEAVAVGDGTAGRETEAFVGSLDVDNSLVVTLVNEDGASIYSASEAARREFPREDITVRGAVSIGRRLQDPLAELVKIDPKSIGVGQYQHDVDQAELKKALGEVVERCVNRVGVEVNSASVELLSYVAGLGPALAANIVAYRQEHGPFARRRDLLKVKRLGAKAFEQCAGFLRIRNSTEPLDNSGVHPERYALVQSMAAELGVDIETLQGSEQLRRRLDLDRYLSEDVGMETLVDIIGELARPGRDPRKKFSHFRFDDTVHSLDDLREGMVLPAIITNVTTFGAFADIGIKQDGLIHISQMANRFVKDPAEVVHVRQQVRVRVIGVDPKRKRIALSLIL